MSLTVIIYMYTNQINFVVKLFYFIKSVHARARNNTNTAPHRHTKKQLENFHIFYIAFISLTLWIHLTKICLVCNFVQTVAAAITTLDFDGVPFCIKANLICKFDIFNWRNLDWRAGICKCVPSSSLAVSNFSSFECKRHSFGCVCLCIFN